MIHSDLNELSIPRSTKWFLPFRCDISGFHGDEACPITTTLSKYMLRVGRLASSDDSQSYAGGSLSSWQGHPSRKGQRARETILCAIHWFCRLGVGRGAATPPGKKFLVTKPHIKELRINEATEVLKEL
jgi:hypothetical protein